MLSRATHVVRRLRYAEHMPEHAHDDPAPGREPPRARRADPFSLHAYLDRQLEEFADGPTMTDVLRDMDQYRRPDGPTSEEIVEALHEAREERMDQLEGL